jgi:hypothetical protein
LEESGQVGGLEVADDALEVVAGAVEYVHEVADEAGDVKRLEEVLGYVRKEKVLLVKYSGEMLTETIAGLNMSAHKMYSSMQ